MKERTSYPMSALFFLVTLFGVLLAIGSSPRAAQPETANFWLLMAAACCGGILGPIVMAYQTRKWDLLVLSYFVGAAVSLVAIRHLSNPHGFRVAIGGAAILLVYGIAARFAYARSHEGHSE